MNEDMWRAFVNTLDELPEGKSAPNMENMKKGPIRDGESPVLLQKVITEVYVYTSVATNDMWYGAQTIQDVQVLGTMRLSEAAALIEKNKRKRRR